MMIVMKKMSSISVRVPFVIIIVAAIASMLIGAFSFFKSAKEMRSEAAAKLTALTVSRHQAIKQHLDSVEEDISLLASRSDVVSALKGFNLAFGAMNLAERFEEETALRQVFSKKKPEGDRTVLRRFNSSFISAYFDIHNRYHDQFFSTYTLKGYYDIFLISTKGDVIYTAFKEPDFASNVFSGKWSDTGLARVAKKTFRDGFGFEDFTNYEPSNGAPAAFVARQVKDKGRVIGALVVQLPINRINKVMQVTAGMGKTGETYLVGPDRLMRSDSRFLESSSILVTTVDTSAVTRALNGETGNDVIKDYRGVPVVSAFLPLTIFGTIWAVIAEIDVSEVDAPIIALRNSIALIALVFLLLVGLVGFLLARTITVPLTMLSRSITDFRKTHKPVNLKKFFGDNEIGEIARGFQETATEVSEYIVSINQAHAELDQTHKIMHQDIETASLVQQSLLPPSVFVTGSFQFSSLARPSFHLGGDTMNYFPLTERICAFYLVDVSGHGVSAALLAVSLTTILNADFCREAPSKERFAGLPNPASLMQILNTRFAATGENLGYFTAVYGLLDIQSGNGVLCVAGQPPPLVCAPDGKVQLVGGDGFPIGLLDDAEYEDTPFHLAPGERLVLYSDGVTEAESPDGKQFGLDGLQKILGHGNSEDIKSISDAVDHWRNGKPLDDDLSIICCRRILLR
jgi:serine phosphatase RsbU (regulator of sigma subunit)